MPNIVLNSAVNTAAQVVPDLTVDLITPQVAAISGTPTDILGVVGTASFGPVNTPVIVSGSSDFATSFGNMQPRKYDAGTQAYTASLQGASDFRVVRVTDGTDTAASVTLSAAELAKAPAFYAALAMAINGGIGVVRGASALVSLNAASGLLAALYTGSLGDGVVVAVSAGSKAGTARAVVGMSGRSPEVFDNISAPALPTFQSLSLTGGTDGASNVTSAMLVGVDEQPRSGIYALRGQGVSHLVVADMDDATQWTVVDAFASSESCYAHQVAPAGSTIAAVVAAKATEGLDSSWSTLLHGDWLYINDPIQQAVRLVSPQGFKAGKLAALSPEQSSLNKPLVGIIGSQTSAGANGAYSNAELSVLLSAGIDLICNPAPGGKYWSVRGGRNSSSNAAVNTDAYTTMADFVATSIAAVMGEYVGVPIDLTLLQNASASLNNFFSGLVDQDILGTVSGALPYKVTCDASNNPGVRTGQGYVQANVMVQTKAINQFFSVDAEVGPTVTIGSAS